MKDRLRSMIEHIRSWDPALAGAAIGFGIGFFWMVLGFWKMLFILILSGLGYYLGMRFFTDPEELRQLLDRIFPPGRTR